MSDGVLLVGEPLALDLVNTRSAVGDALATPEGLRGWLLLEADRLPEMPQEITGRELEAVRALREHTARTLDHVRRGVRPRRADIGALNRFQRAAPAISELSWRETGVVATRRRLGSASERLTAWLAEAAADFLARPDVAKVRECEADDCILLFLPAHPRRRWCSAARCGNRARVARHYQRHKAG
ncbi:CGNR zinc finger domain-containing protein [Saccharomonospora cyanea]|uniref:Zn-ribbon-like motif containing protein n=1 Tax=Saccharomonospora cyanea NA-134 TaxID=882082 RepID=H5XEC0_9PSEU|nr:ABATE domain-containing protein [Saccharomonospora cyanea]EHR61388.1 Zn-ribbon-like motif containing protein [Saccharomonospora cyanea NA-134]